MRYSVTRQLGFDEDLFKEFVNLYCTATPKYTARIIWFDRVFMLRAMGFMSNELQKKLFDEWVEHERLEYPNLIVNEDNKSISFMETYYNYDIKQAMTYDKIISWAKDHDVGVKFFPNQNLLSLVAS